MIRGEFASELASECAAVFGGATIRGVAARDAAAGAGMCASSVCDDVIRRAGIRSIGPCRGTRSVSRRSKRAMAFLCCKCS